MTLAVIKNFKLPFCASLAFMLAALTACKGEKVSNKRFNSCLAKIETKLAQRSKLLQKKYLHVDPLQGSVKEGQNTLFKKGTAGSPAVLLLHGNLSFPADMRLLIEELNRQGMTVLAPLIPGYGSSIEIANAARISDWKNAVDVHYRILSTCFDQLALIGFSLGGLLATDFTLNRYPSINEYKNARLTSLTLLSPAIEPSVQYIDKIINASEFLEQDRIPFWLIDMVSEDASVKRMMKHPHIYNQAFPIYTGENVHDLSIELKSGRTPRFLNRDLPVSLIYSQNDKATNWRATRDFLSEHFFDVRSFTFYIEDKIPHNLEINSTSLAGRKIRNGLARLIKSHTNNYNVVDIHSAIPSWIDENIEED